MWTGFWTGADWRDFDLTTQFERKKPPTEVGLTPEEDTDAMNRRHEASVHRRARLSSMACASLIHSSATAGPTRRQALKSLAKV